MLKQRKPFSRGKVGELLLAAGYLVYMLISGIVTIYTEDTKRLMLTSN